MQIVCEALSTAWLDAGFVRGTQVEAVRRTRVRCGGQLMCAHVSDRPNVTNDMLANTTPEDGDIVVRQETREGMDVYVLHTARGPDQYLLRAREEAVAQAVTFAKRQGVRAWLYGESYGFVLLNDSRVVEAV